MGVTYIISAILMGVLWYLLKHTYYRKWTGHQYDWFPYKVKRWEVIVLLVLFLIPPANLFMSASGLIYLIVDFDKKFVFDNWLSRKWAKLKEWLKKEV